MATTKWLALVLLLSGCGPAFQVICPVGAGSGVEVWLDRWRHQNGGNFIQTSVYNTSTRPIVVNRDAILLLTPAGPRARLPGGWSSTYEIQPGGHHLVRCIYYVADLRPGDLVQLSFAGAITRDGVPVPVDPIQLIMQSSTYM
jgi:hypothetical protein